MQDTVFLATYIGFMMTLTWMGVAILNNMRQQPRQTIYINATGVPVSEIDDDEATVEEEEEEPNRDEEEEEENTGDN